jgi:hypothetical protein
MDAGADTRPHAPPNTDGGQAADACSSGGTAIRAESWPEADELFHKDGTWLGSDDAYSVDLGNGRVLWLFGDTFIASTPAKVRSQSTFIHNSVAIQSGYDPSDASIAFAWGVKDGGTPIGFFSDDLAPTHWYWPADGAVVDGKLVIFLQEIEPFDNGASGFNFKVLGVALARVDNPEDSPASWVRTIVSVPATLGVTFGDTILADPDAGAIEVLGRDSDGGVHLARWPALAATADAGPGVPTWWTPSGWVTQSSLDAAPPSVFSGSTPGFTVQPGPCGAEWVEVQTTTLTEATLDVRTTFKLSTSWGTPVVAYTPPESSEHGVIVYAGKGHPELHGAQLVATYATNSGDGMDTADADVNIYYPRFVRVNWVAADAGHD